MLLFEANDGNEAVLYFKRKTRYRINGYSDA
jgi:hypothetical protein